MRKIFVRWLIVMLFVVLMSTVFIPMTHAATLSVSPGGIIGAADACPIPADSQTYNSVDKAIECAAAGDTITINPGTYTVGGVAAPLITIDKNLIIVGAGAANNVILQPSTNTGNSGDARAWFLVNAGVNLTVTDLTFDGNGLSIWQAFRHRGSGEFNRVAFNDIQFQPSGPSYAGTAIAAFGNGNVNVFNSTFTNIGRIGVQYFGAGVTNGTFRDNTYTGKGDGDHLDYGVEVGAGANATIEGNVISGNRGVASVDGSTSAAILVTTFFGPGTSATIAAGNNLNNNTSGVAIGFDMSDTSTVNINNNTITNNTANGIGASSAGTVTIASNTITSNGDGIDLANVANATIQRNLIDQNGSGVELANTNATINNNNIFDSNTIGVDVSDATSSGTVINNNQFCNNTQFGVQNQAATIVDATNNWWGAVDGPAPVGSGDAISAGVTFNPFNAISPGASPCALQTNTIGGSSSTGGETVVDESGPALCSFFDGSVNEIVRADVPDLTVTDGSVFCRVIAENGNFVTSQAEIGHIAVIQRGVIQAVDVFGLRMNGDPAPDFNGFVNICLRGTGNFYYLSALQSPRVPQRLSSSQMTIAGQTFTCARIPDAGTVVLTEN
ncbi:MAG: hypothetical protein CUN54_06315 [Phototrophicales bacterium]|nr:MAG: hypothetical protein CUN54_06315 [Phototrophicales bacterium]